MRALLVLFLLLVASPLAAQDGEPYADAPFDQRQFTCPLGGESFTQDVGYSSLPLETLPDGSWLGDLAIDAQIPVCPGNGLVILPDYGAMQEQQADRMAYRSYTEAELAQLPALIADPEYAALKTEGRHAQAYWLATRLGLPATERFRLIQRATWAALAPDLRRRLVTKLVTDGPSLIDASGLPDEQQRAARFYVVNGLRELGRFDEALALLERIEASGPPVAAPVDPDDIFVEEWAPEVRLAIAEKDDGRFPIELLSRRMVFLICGDDAFPPYDQRNLAACKARREREQREDAEQAVAFEESEELEKDLPALERRCGETAADARSAGLEMACDGLQRDRDEKAGAELLTNHARQLVQDCERSPADRRKGPLFFACISYDIAVGSAVSDLLAGDDATYGIVCADGGKGDGTDDLSKIQSACSSAELTRSDREQAKLLTDVTALDAQCATLAEDDYEQVALQGACFQRKLDLDREETEKVASDPREFARRCGKIAPADYDAMTDDEFKAASFCEDVLRVQQRAKDKAAGVECFEDVSLALEGEQAPPDERRCVPLEQPGQRTIASSYFDQHSELSQVARERAAQIVAAARAEAEAH